MGFFSKLKEGLTKTRDNIVSGIDSVFSGFSSIDDDFYDELEAVSYTHLIETALGGTIQNIVTDKESTAKELIAYLKQNKLGRATFLPLNAISGRNTLEKEPCIKENGVIGIASNLVRVSFEYENLSLIHIL